MCEIFGRVSGGWSIKDKLTRAEQRSFTHRLYSDLVALKAPLVHPFSLGGMSELSTIATKQPTLPIKLSDELMINLVCVPCVVILEIPMLPQGWSKNSYFYSLGGLFLWDSWRLFSSSSLQRKVVVLSNAQSLNGPQSLPTPPGLSGQ